MNGAWVIVCGPSGAGKDSVLDWARDALQAHPSICFARRLVTRPSVPGSEHEEVSPAALLALRAQGALAWYWEAHGLAYGVRADYARRVAAGTVVVVNGSRAHARALAGRGDVRCVLVTARAATLQERLLGRGREQAGAVAARLARNAELAPPTADHVIANEGALPIAGTSLRDYLLELAR